MYFKNLELKKDYLGNASIIQINDHDVEVKHYIPIRDKIDLVQVALQKAKENGIYNQMKLDVYFHLNILYSYTNIDFSDEDREDEMELYDILESNGVINDVITVMNDTEYQDLRTYLYEMKENDLNYSNTAAAVIQRFIRDLPTQIEATKEALDNFDMSKYPELMNFVTAANGGRDIRTNTVPFNPPAQE